MSRRIRVLFIAEAITLAQVVRLVTLARGLDPARFEVHFASAHFDELAFAGTSFTRHAVYSLDAARAFRRLERGQRIYETRVLARYVEDELRLFRTLSPDVVVGDLRVSLTVSAPHASIPHAALINAYWSRAMVRDAFPLPDHPIVSLLGEELAARYFPKALPWVLRYFAAPVNQLRARYGLSALGDFVDVLLSADRVLFPDAPYLTPLSTQRASEVFLGFVPWSPEGPLPPWWHEPLPARPAAYVTLGSSGRLDRLPVAIAGLTGLGLSLMVATAGRADLTTPEESLRSAPFLPGDQAARRAAFVVCNGGSSTGYQALVAGRPVLGIPSNLDQYLAMTAVRDAGAGILLRADTLTAERVEAAARALLSDPAYTNAAARAGRALAAIDCHARFRGALEELTGRA